MPWPLTQPASALATDVTAQTTRHADDHNKIAALLAVLTPQPWQYVNPIGGNNPSFATGWFNFAGGTGGWQPLRIRREGGDICRIEGCIAGGTSGNAIFTLPIGFRPAQAIRFHITADATGTNSNPCRLDINQGGPGIVALTLLSGSGTFTFASIVCTFAIDPTTL